MTAQLAVVGPSALWYLTRSTGAVALLLLSASVALGVANVERLHATGWPRFVVEGIHRNVSLLALAVLFVHIATSVLDPFAGIHLIDAVIPFAGAYRPLWLGLGAFASDLLIAIALTSVVRRHLSLRAWRGTHLLAYLCWPLAVLHTAGTGSDIKQVWLQVILAVCAAAVLAAVWFRIACGWPRQRRVRAGALVASIALPAAFLIWLPSGPLGASWARRSGTPSKDLAAVGESAGSGSRTSAAGASVPLAFTGEVHGSASEHSVAGGLAVVQLALTAPRQGLDELAITIEGTPADGGGVRVTSSRVSFGTASAPALYTGTITSLEGTSLVAHVSAADGRVLRLALALQIDAGAATGTLQVSPR